jgi:L,D-transpeptidase ErfK/SrfK
MLTVLGSIRTVGGAGVLWCSVMTFGLPTARGATVEPLVVFDQVAGDESVHAVASGETLGHIAERFGMKTQLAASINGLSDPHRLHIGQRLRMSNRHIVPSSRRDAIIINVGDLILYWVREGEVVASFPVGVGRKTWQTPPGHYTIVGRRRDPVWHVPASIQKEMHDQGQPVKKLVPAGPDNPLGKYWLQLSAGGYGIHGTNAPRSVGRYTTHGCVRLRPDDIERLYNEVPTGTSVDIVDEPVKLARVDGDRILLESHRGPRGNTAESVPVYMQRLRASGVMDLVDAATAEWVLRNTWGIAIDVSKQRGPRRLGFEQRADSRRD